MMIRFCCAILLVQFLVCSFALADTLTVDSSAVSTISLAPSNDTLSLNGGSVTASGPGDVVFQSGTFSIGSSPIADQAISFSFDDAVTINGVQQTITVFGSDSVSQGVDVLTIFAGQPTLFGGYVFTLDGGSFSGTWVGQQVPVTLSGQVAPTPEPTSLLLLGTGLLGGLAVMRLR